MAASNRTQRISGADRRNCFSLQVIFRGAQVRRSRAVRGKRNIFVLLPNFVQELSKNSNEEADRRVVCAC